jgi:hypothetical protein
LLLILTIDGGIALTAHRQMRQNGEHYIVLSNRTAIFVK